MERYVGPYAIEEIVLLNAVKVAIAKFDEDPSGSKRKLDSKI